MSLSASTGHFIACFTGSGFFFFYLKETWSFSQWQNQRKITSTKRNALTVMSEKSWKWEISRIDCSWWKAIKIIRSQKKSFMWFLSHEHTLCKLKQLIILQLWLVKFRNGCTIITYEYHMLQMVHQQISFDYETIYYLCQRGNILLVSDCGLVGLSAGHKTA